MSDDTRGPDPTSGVATPSAPPPYLGLIRSLVHRLAGEPPALPIDGAWPRSTARPGPMPARTVAVSSTASAPIS
jgi:hypothetical protein